MPAFASPAANSTACCSAMPTSKKRFGSSSQNGPSPVAVPMAAVIATIRTSSFANSSNLLPNTSENETSLDELFDDNKLPLSILNGPTPWNFLGNFSDHE